MTQETIDKKIRISQEEIALAEKYIEELAKRKQELQEFIESLKAMEANQIGRAKYGRAYWYVDEIGQIVSTTECDTLSDNYRYESGNYYLTSEDAERAEKQIRLFRLLDRFSRQNGWTDELWEDGNLWKWYIYCGHCGRTTETGFTRHHRDIYQVYFVSESVARQAIEKYHDLIMEVMAI